MRFADIVQVRNGKLAAGRSYWDTGAFTSQLGITLEALAGAAV
jgi:ketosteroid isomerase-like protein